MSAGRGPGRPFPKGTGGNPGGRRHVTKALREAGFDPDSLCKEVIEKVIECFRTLDAGDKDEGQSWRWCADKAWILVNLPSKSAEASAQTTLTEAEYNEELDIIARERIEKMTPEERIKLLANTAPSDTVQ